MPTYLYFLTALIATPHPHPATFINRNSSLTDFLVLDMYKKSVFVINSLLILKMF